MVRKHLCVSVCVRALQSVSPMSRNFTCTMLITEEKYFPPNYMATDIHVISAAWLPCLNLNFMMEANRKGRMAMKKFLEAFEHCINFIHHKISAVIKPECVKSLLRKTSGKMKDFLLLYKSKMEEEKRQKLWHSKPAITLFSPSIYWWPHLDSIPWLLWITLPISFCLTDVIFFGHKHSCEISESYLFLLF